MCGIAGIVRRGATTTLESETRRMLDALAHRGPDDTGILTFVPGGGTASVTLGACRLAMLFEVQGELEARGAIGRVLGDRG